MTHRTDSRLLRAVLLGLMTASAMGAGLGLAGCRSRGPNVSDVPNLALRPLNVPAHATAADEDRAALSRFVGVWDFEGWSTDAEGQKQKSSGTAAAAIEHEHFVLFEVRSAVGTLSGQAGRSAGSMLLASEPGSGLALTAWGDAAPAVRRLTGHVHGNGSAFGFSEPGGRTSLVLTFETDDRWVAEVRDGRSGDPVIAKYTFTRRSR